MKISNFFPQIKTDLKVQKSRESSAVSSNTPSSVLDADRVELSTSSLDVQKMKGILKDTPEVRQDRVQELKAQIERGEYKVDPYKVADKLLMNLLSEGL